MEEIDKSMFRDYWYRQKFVIYEIAKLAQYREMVFIDKNRERMPVRCMFPYKVDAIVEYIENYRFINTFGYNIYLSVAQFQNPPLFSYKAEERRDQMDKWSFGEPPEYRNHFKGYDLFFDFDSPIPDDLEAAYKDMLKMKASLDKFQVPAIFSFSGTKGFHVRMPFKILPQTLGWDLVTFCKLIGEMCSKKMELKTLDIGVFDDRRVFKAPYSYDRGNICLPLDDDQIENFDIKQMGVVNVLNKLKIFNRGDLMRHTNFSIEQQREHFREWFKELRK